MYDKALLVLYVQHEAELFSSERNADPIRRNF